jgi:dynein heavy chain
MYGYEYMGATSRLVITPLTDKCWITITGALHIKLGANPAGPAGTGKTESTKDLAKAIAIYCVVYNCSDQVVYKIIKQHFKGLAQQGCWTCLDEFNRIDIEVLSVIAQLLQTIRNELIKVPLPERFFFEDADIRLLPDFGCHVTMNPGYAGRQELPDNLKVLFRPVAMMVPSYQLIAEIMLGAEGFSESKILSRKMKNLYKLSSEQLSQQSHYDFGMRAVKSVLVQAGTLKRKYQELPEDSILIRAMCDANVPKFLKDDIPLFYAIVQDLFPSSVLSETDNSEIFKQFTKSCIKFNWQPHVPFMKKIVQLLETFGVRFGVMLVGYTGGGKTASYTILKDTMCALREAGHPDRQFQKVNSQLLNPKSITMDELFGAVDKDTNEWRDGLASKMLRNSANIENDDLDWTIFDGPVDALWIENMNTVLDDNMTLCLANGQRLKLRPQMRMLFEVQDLLVASPATVSRCGMVYMTPEDLGWRPYVKSWITSTFGLPGDESAGIDD